MNLDNIIEKVSNTIKTHRLEKDGEYARWIWNDGENSRHLGINEYGCADAVNILYTIGQFPNTSESRENHIRVLQNLQNPDSGMFVEATHHPIHTTAHCIAALELFDIKPKYPLKELAKYSTNEGLCELLENIDWKTNPWDGSHKGAGIYASMVLSESVDSKWQDTYFEWLWNNSNSNTGCFMKTDMQECTAPPFYNVGATFHYLFNLEYKHMPLRYPDKLIDFCLDIYNNQDEYTKGALAPSNIGFSIADWVYCLTRASRQTPHRHKEITECLKKMAELHISYLDNIDETTNDDFNDLHRLFGCVCGLAELQSALPGMIKSKKPLKLVLDRRPFI